MLTILLYTPILLNNGVAALVDNPIVRQLKVDSLNLLSEDFFARVGGAWREWHTGYGALSGVLSMIGVAWAWLRFRKISRHAVSALGVGLLWILAVLVIQMTVGWTRIWFFLSPIYFLYAFAGWGDLVDRLTTRFSRPSGAWVSTALILLVILAGSARWWFQDSRYQELLSGSQGYNQITAGFLADHSLETDLIAVTAPDAPIIWYYGANLGIEVERYNPNSGYSFTHAFLIVNSREGQSVTGVLDSKELLVPSVEQIELVYQSGPLEIYYTPIAADSE
jgi:hypothetical protein